MLDKIKSLPTSDGSKGWPVAVKDRIAYSDVKEANVAVTFLWTIRDSILPKLDKGNLAIATNFYTPAGLEGMVRNILANPYIRYVIMLGEEYSSREDHKTDLTAANAIRIFFEKGINEDRKIQGFESAVNFDKNIPTEAINKVKDNVILIDLNKEFPNIHFDEKIKKINQLLKNLPRKKTFSQPLVFKYESAEESFPYENGPIIVHGKTIPLTWIEIMHNIYRYGKRNLMNANTDRWVKEINNLVAVIHDPQNLSLEINPFLVPISKEKIEAYQKEILSPLLPEGKAYTYGNKLRAYLFDNPELIRKLVNTDEYKDFEFGKGDFLDKNIVYKEKFCEIDQIKDIIEVLKRDPYSKACIAITWHANEELVRKHKSSPCLVLLQPLIQDEKLNLTTYWRSHDMAQGWPENAYGMAAIQKEIASALGIKAGILTMISSSAQIYNHYYKQIEEMLKRYRKFNADYYDPKGNYMIKVENKIIAEHTHPGTHKVLEVFEGYTAREVYLKIAEKNDIKTDHAMYLGAELKKAEYCLKNNQKFIQDKD